MAEESFPRGGAEKKSLKHAVKTAKSNDDLFKISDEFSGDQKKSKRKKEKKKPAIPTDVSSSDHVIIEKFSLRNVVENMLILGRVKEIFDYKVLVSLPENVVAELSITDISAAYTAALKAIADDEIKTDEDQLVGSLEDLFEVGQLICCYVKKVQSIGKRKEIHLSVDPKLVNSDIEPGKLTPSCIISASVASKEDHGYSLDLGIHGLRAFVPNSEATQFNKDGPLWVGMPILCSITKASIQSMGTASNRVVTVKLKGIRSKLVDTKNVLRNIQPGTVVNGTVVSVKSNGIVVKFCGKFNGFVYRHHLNADVLKFVKDQEVTLCVLYHQPLVGVSSLSMLGHLTDQNSSKLSHFKLVKVGEIIDSASVLSIEDKLGALLKLKSDIHGYLPLKFVHDKASECSFTNFPKTGIRCRVVDFDLMNNVAIVSTSKKFLERKILKLSDYKTGEVIEGKIKRFVEGNIIVDIDGIYHGFVPSIHNADVPLKKPEVKYKVNESIKCRILKIESKDHVTLTAKESLVKSKFPILNAFEKLKHGMVVEGVIVKVTSSGLLVLFYNEVRGFVHRTEAGFGLNILQDNFYVGQVVKCRVLSWCQETQRIHLSLKLDSQEQVGVKELELQAGLDGRSFHSCKIFKITDRGLSVRIGNVSGFIPVHQLSDNFVNCKHLLQLYKPHQTIDEAVLFERAATPIFTLKKSIVNALRASEVPQSMDELLPGTTVRGVVRNAASFGLFIQLSHCLRGIAINKLISNKHIEDASKHFPFGQSVLVHVKETDPERNRILCSLRMSDCYMGDTQPAVDLLSSYLDERRRIVEHYKERGSDAVKSLLMYDVGSVIDVVVDNLNDHGMIGHELASNVPIICTIFHMQGPNVKVGDVRKAVVLHQDLDYNCLEVSLSSKVVKAISHRVDGPSNQVKAGSVAKAEVMLVKPDFVLIAILGHAEFKFAYAPAQKCPNDVMGSQFFEPGFTDKVVVKMASNPVICSWEAFENAVGKTGAVKRIEAHKLRIGSKVCAVVKDVLPCQLNIRIGGLPGRIFASELSTDKLVRGQRITSEYKVGQSLDVVVIGFRCVKSQKPLGPDADHSKGIPECSIRGDRLNGDLSTTFENQQQIAGFYHQIRDDFIEFRVAPSVTAFCRCINSDLSPEVLNHAEHITPGAYYPLMVRKSKNAEAKKLEVTMMDCSSMETGSVVTGCVMKVKKDSLLLRLSGNYRGIVTPTEMSDEYEDFITERFRVGQYYRCHVLRKNEESNVDNDYVDAFYVSLRRSRCAQVPSKIEPRDKVIENAADLIPQEVVRGYVYSCVQQQVTVLLGDNVYGLARKRHLPDVHLKSMKAVYPKWKVVTVKILSVSGSRVTVSLRPDDTGVVEEVLALPQRKRRNSGRVSESDSVDSCQPPSQKRKLSPGGSPRKRTESESSSTRERKTSVSDSPAFGTRKRRLSEMSDGAEGSQGGMEMEKVEVEENLENLPRFDAGSDSSSSDEEEEITLPPPAKKKKMKKEPEAVNESEFASLKVNEGFAWVSDFNLPVRNDDESDSSDDADDGDTAQVVSKKSKKSEERKLMELENRLLDTSRKPETEDEFDRLVVQSPDSSLVWMQYMAHHLKMAEIDKARKVADRALKTISFREEQEKLNVWVALMNLENLYGSPDQLRDVFDRAVQMNDPFRVHYQLVQIYENTDKFEQAERLYSSMVRQFGRKKEVWISFGQFYFGQKRFDSARKILERSLKTLDKRDHMEVVTKFGRMEFENGQQEQAVHLFERVLAECPKRTDVWMVYIDLLIKYSSAEKIRKVFLKVIDLKIPPKKMKSIFKKWLDFENKFGDSESVAEVKQHAAQYAKSNLHLI